MHAYLQNLGLLRDRLRLGHFLALFSFTLFDLLLFSPFPLLRYLQPRTSCLFLGLYFCRQVRLDLLQSFSVFHFALLNLALHPQFLFCFELPGLLDFSLGFNGSCISRHPFCLSFGLLLQ
jgi:hypothetical protein